MTTQPSFQNVWSLADSLSLTHSLTHSFTHSFTLSLSISLSVQQQIEFHATTTIIYLYYYFYYIYTHDIVLLPPTKRNEFVLLSFFGLGGIWCLVFEFRKDVLDLADHRLDGFL